MIKTEGLTHIHLAVTDLHTSLQFYSDVFGMEEMFRVGTNMIFMNTPGSKDTITLRQADAGDTVGPGGVGHFGFRLTKDQDLDAAIADATTNGGSLIEQGKHEDGSPFAYVGDPDGYVIEL